MRSARSRRAAGGTGLAARAVRLLRARAHPGIDGLFVTAARGAGRARAAARPGAPDDTRCPATPGPGEVTLFDAAKDLADLDGWVSSRHLTRKALDAASGLVDGCTRSLTTAGTTAELLVCFGGGMDQVGEKDTLVLLAVDAGGIRVAFRQTVHMTDAPDEGPLRRGHEVQASVLLRDGRDLVVREDDGTCRILGQPLSPGYRARAVAMCAGIGRYSWRAGRFVRTGPP
jgi:hypothetical protein